MFYVGFIKAIALGFHDDTSHVDDLSSAGSPFFSNHFEGALMVSRNTEDR